MCLVSGQETKDKLKHKIPSEHKMEFLFIFNCEDSKSTHRDRLPTGAVKSPSLAIFSVWVDKIRGFLETCCS